MLRCVAGYVTIINWMFMKSLCISAALWSFIAAPALCEGGFLPHACESHSSQGCGHEDDCNNDPCAQFTPATLQKSQRQEISHSDLVPVIILVDQTILSAIPLQSLASSHVDSVPESIPIVSSPMLI